MNTAAQRVAHVEHVSRHFGHSLGTPRAVVKYLTSLRRVQLECPEVGGMLDTPMDASQRFAQGHPEIMAETNPSHSLRRARTGEPIVRRQR